MSATPMELYIRRFKAAQRRARASTSYVHTSNTERHAMTQVGQYTVGPYSFDTYEEARMFAPVFAERTGRRVHIMHKPDSWTAAYSMQVFDEQGQVSTIQY